jgi:hypothetical protein
MTDLQIKFILGLLRHGLTFVSTWLLAQGVTVSDGQIETVVGAIGVVLTIVLQYIAKRRETVKEAELKRAANLPLGYR